ncbi:MAG: hypothetical protein A3B91_02445 [Candidatus Yanofskybacteria bacterium RIFCSPHIGHO2_02_FULL_41_29]|uniref:PE-PGRS family protein n=1 Tax=Candidatus Yanofskybacteria bacterium RIFCSPHIGHO2_01_FULL_41_53 TaxID=1802663 RepID=A0A1F8EMZ7_9BACT|nr:MAG: hypothetical protein A2650_03865 [Candidatus Yanofskybacteria bacterium RIFCSPHIGHO2_01_FULL_41_53]OGN10380.1 MAG: hypothetical protein A3B91_02445 [Candidatus Yanofskybacteria bacterium RIFCSPHIGHO2_02_FULL_41_29]OGN21325.1 MAG: hypothetical protein A2916_00345 [Candidatus Yanofskybacteria bacterium RIFCSPLOWO2_01_FULL_41_67]OGN29095.1 MAG: hypothetical protein A3H54_04995 [Candidatus Yanofskybacteria bacterium RIFCSPLOWO2_02_FULL_41_13]OGN34216.1 MAG: hypothetical protein A3F98_01420 
MFKLRNIFIVLLVFCFVYPSSSVKTMFELPEAEAGFRKVIFLTNADTSWTVPNDWNNQANMIEVIAGGGGAGDGNGEGTGGAGGGAYAKGINIQLVPGTVMVAPTNFDIGDGGPGATSPNVGGSNGGDTWFNASSLANCITLGNTVCVAAENGMLSAGNNTTAGAGGEAANSVGVVTFNGGTGGVGDSGAADAGAGGGGAAGPNGPGNTGIDGASGGAGGSGDAGFGGAGGTGGATNGNNGGDGKEWGTNGSTAGSGGGGEGGTNGAIGGNGGLYGAGGGGGEANAASGLGDGTDGIIVITYVPSGHVIRGLVKIRGYVRFR